MRQAPLVKKIRIKSLIILPILPVLIAKRRTSFIAMLEPFTLLIAMPIDEEPTDNVTPVPT
jgi:hypothetical protein